jgi:hypothetical protein
MMGPTGANIIAPPPGKLGMSWNALSLTSAAAANRTAVTKLDLSKSRGPTSAALDTERKVLRLVEQLEAMSFPTTTPVGISRFERMQLLHSRLALAITTRGSQALRAKYRTTEQRVPIFVAYRVERALHQLMLAARNGDADGVVAAVNNGAPPGYILPSGHTPLTLLIMLRSAHAIPALLELGANIAQPSTDGFTPLMLAVLEGHKGTINALCGEGGKSVAIDALHVVGREDASPLMIAVAQGKLEVATQLLKLGASVAAKNSKGRNALHFAARFRHLSCATRLLGHLTMPDPLARDNSGFSAADWLRAAARERVMRRAKGQTHLRADAARRAEDFDIELDDDTEDATDSLFAFGGPPPLGAVEQEMMKQLREGAVAFNKRQEKIAHSMAKPSSPGGTAAGTSGSVRALTSGVGARRGSVIATVKGLVGNAGPGMNGLSALMAGPSSGVVRRGGMDDFDADDDDGASEIVPDVRDWPASIYITMIAPKEGLPAGVLGGRRRGDASMRTGEEADNVIAESGKSDWAGFGTSGSTGTPRIDQPRGPLLAPPPTAIVVHVKPPVQRMKGGTLPVGKTGTLALAAANLDPDALHAHLAEAQVPLLIPTDSGRSSRGLPSTTMVLHPSRSGDPIAYAIHTATAPLSAIMAARSEGMGRAAPTHEEILVYAATHTGPSGLFEQFGETESHRKALDLYHSRLTRAGQEESVLGAANADVEPLDPSDVVGYEMPRLICGYCGKHQAWARVRCLNCAQPQCARCTLWLHRQPGLRHHRIKPLLPTGMTEGILMQRQATRRRAGMAVHDARQPSLNEDDPLYLQVVRRLARIVRMRTAEDTAAGSSSSRALALQDGGEACTTIGFRATVQVPVIPGRDLTSLDDGLVNAPKRGVYKKWVAHLLPVEMQPPTLRPPTPNTMAGEDYAGPPPSVVAKLVALYPESAKWLGIPTKRVKPIFQRPSDTLLAQPPPKAPSATGGVQKPAAVAVAVASPRPQVLAVPAQPVPAPAAVVAPVAPVVAAPGLQAPALSPPVEPEVAAPAPAPRARRASVAADVMARRASIQGGGGGRRASVSQVEVTTTGEGHAGDQPRQRRVSVLAAGGLNASAIRQAPPTTTVESSTSGAARRGSMVAAAEASAAVAMEAYAAGRRNSLSGGAGAAAAAAVREARARRASISTGPMGAPQEAAPLAEAPPPAVEMSLLARGERRRSIIASNKAANDAAVAEALGDAEQGIFIAAAAECSAPPAGRRGSVVAGGRRGSIMAIAEMEAKQAEEEEGRSLLEKAKAARTAAHKAGLATLFSATASPELALAEHLAATGRWDEAAALCDTAVAHAISVVGMLNPSAVVLALCRYAALALRQARKVGSLGAGHGPLLDSVVFLSAKAREWSNCGCGVYIFPTDGTPVGAVAAEGGGAGLDVDHPAVVLAAALTGALLLDRGDALGAITFIGGYACACLEAEVGRAPTSVPPISMAYAVWSDANLLPSTPTSSAAEGLGLHETLKTAITAWERLAMAGEDVRWGRKGADAFVSAPVQAGLEASYRQRRGSVLLGASIASRDGQGPIVRAAKGHYQLTIRCDAAELDMALSETRWAGLLRKHALTVDAAAVQPCPLVICVDFLLAVLQFKVLGTLDTRRRAAAQLRDRFLLPDVTYPLPMPTVTRLTIIGAMREDAAVSLFDGAALAVRAYVTALLLPSFLASARGARYMDERGLIVGLPTWSLPQVAKLAEPDRTAQVAWMQAVVRGWIKRCAAARARGETVLRGRIIHAAPVIDVKARAEAAKKRAKARETVSSTAASAALGKGFRWTSEEANALLPEVEPFANHVSTPELHLPGVAEAAGAEGKEGQGSRPTSSAKNAAKWAPAAVWDEERQATIEPTTGYILDPSGSGWWWDSFGPGGGAWLFWDPEGEEFVTPEGQDEDAMMATAAAEDLVRGRKEALLAVLDAASAERMGWPRDVVEAWAAVKIQTLTRGVLARKGVAALSDSKWAPLLDASSGSFYYLRLDGTGTTSWKLPAHLPYGRVTFKAVCDACGLRRSTAYCETCEEGLCEMCDDVHAARYATEAHVCAALPRKGTIVCIECDRRVGQRSCTNCGCAFCPSCWPRIHSKGSRVRHTWGPAYRTVDAEEGAGQPAYERAQELTDEAEPGQDEGNAEPAPEE